MDGDNGSAASGGSADMALNAAMSGVGASEEARTLLRKQAQLVDLQIEDLRREDKLRHWSLRIRHVSDLMKLTFELSMATIVLALAVLIGTAIWKAAHDNSLVIESFSVPGDMAARGVTGQAVAAQLQDKLTAMQNQTDSARPAESYANNWGNDIKVQIPDTGVSVGEFYRMLAAWFGHQTHISGEVYRTPDDLAVTVRASGNPGDTIRGNERDLDTLMQKAAEAIYARTQAFRYAIYLAGRPQLNSGRVQQILQKLAESGSLRDRVWAYMGIGTHAEFADPLHAPEIQARAIPLVPRFALPYQNIATEDSWLGHDEMALAAGQKAVDLLANGDGEMSVRASTISLPSGRAAVAELTGDYDEAERRNVETTLVPDYAHIAEAARASMAEDYALLHETGAARKTWNSLPVPTVRIGVVKYHIAEIGLLYDLKDWQAVVEKTALFESLLKETAHVPPYAPAFAPVTLSRQIWPYTAAALAHRGDMKGALALIAKTPLDCDLCVRMRGNIAALNHDWNGAEHWFAMVSSRTPSIPFADSDWGAMLMAKGDRDGAIAKFTLANKKGPHFADPLEMWGEALIVKNRSDLALAKFEEADKYAPNWGRLHLKWGEALIWSGDKSGAAQQFAQAAHLGLTAAEKAELTRMRAAR